MSADADDATFFDVMQDSVDRFEDENEDLEALFHGDIGIHGYYTETGDRCRGVQIAMLAAVMDELGETAFDDDIVEANYGEVTPDTVRQAVHDQLRDLTGFGGKTIEAMADAAAEHVADRMESDR